MRLIVSCFAALLLAGCAGSSLGGLTGGASPVAKPKTIVVTDFVFGDGVTAIDRAYSVRLERKIGSFPPHERKPRTLERVNEEIVANVVATLRGAGLDAQPGGADSGTLSEGTVLVSGTLRSTEPVAGDSKKSKPVTDQVGFGTGRTNVVADVKMLSSGKRQLAAFTADAGAGRAAPTNAKLSASHNSAIAAALAEQRAAPEKLSPEVEGQARRLGRSIGDKVLAYAREQGWLEAAIAAAEPEKPADLPAAKPDKKSEQKPPKKPAAANAPDGDVKPEN
jgi:hypothetical protein